MRLFGNSIPVSLKRGKEILGLLVPHGPHSEAPPVRARADPGIIAIAPVSEVVAAFLPEARMVADLVGGDSGGRGAVVGDDLTAVPGDLEVELQVVTPSSKAKNRVGRCVVA